MSIEFEMNFKKVNQDKVIGPGFEVDVSGASPSTFCVNYRDVDCRATAEIEGGINESGRHDWVIYSETLTFTHEPEGFAEKEKLKAKILERMMEGMRFLGMLSKIG